MTSRGDWKTQAKTKAAARLRDSRVLLHHKPMLVLAAALACFHPGNGAMLPLTVSLWSARQERFSPVHRHHGRRRASGNDRVGTVRLTGNWFILTFAGLSKLVLGEYTCGIYVNKEGRRARFVAL